MKQQTNAPISQTLADFLLRKDLKLSEDLAVTKIMRSGIGSNFWHKQTVQESGTLILGFNENKSGELNLKNGELLMPWEI